MNKKNLASILFLSIFSTQSPALDDSTADEDVPKLKSRSSMMLMLDFPKERRPTRKEVTTSKLTLRWHGLIEIHESRGGKITACRYNPEGVARVTTAFDRFRKIDSMPNRARKLATMASFSKVVGGEFAKSYNIGTYMQDTVFYQEEMVHLTRRMYDLHASLRAFEKGEDDFALEDLVRAFKLHANTQDRCVRQFSKLKSKPRSIFVPSL